MAYRHVFLERDDALDGCGGLEDATSYADWLNFAERLSAKYGDNYVSSVLFLAVRTSDDTVVGMVDIRLRLSEHLATYGGNIGYSVLPSQRRQGYATTMLALALGQCRSLGLDRVLLTCDSDNLGSIKVIEANGGVFEDEAATDSDPSEVVRRYWITP